MTATLADGLLELRLAAGADGSTRVVERRQRFPLRTTVPFHLDPALPGMAFLYVQNPSGAVFAGDRLSTRVDAGPGTLVHLTTPAATKVARMEAGYASERVELRLAAGAYLERIPEPLIPQAGSRYEQAVDVTVEDGAAFVGLEAVAPGRLARGERFEFDRLRLETTVRDAGGEEVAVDSLLLEPSRRNPAARGLLGRHPYAGMLVAVREGRGRELAGALDGALAGVSGVIAGAGALPGDAGAYARVLAETSAALRTALELVWGAARWELVRAPLPPRRK